MPNAGDQFIFQGVRYVVPPARHGVDYPYEAEGGKATVVRIQRLDDKSLWALKIFKYAYRSEAQLRSAARLATVCAVPGLSAGHQLVIEPGDPLVQALPDLQWAVLMPWVEGLTWGEILAQVKRKLRTYTTYEAQIFAFRIATVLERLESSGLVHCDLSSGNVLLPTLGKFGIELVDLEGMIIRQQHEKVETPGTPGYALPGIASTSRPDGDRYAAAILLAEALALAIPSASEHFSSDGLFCGNRTNPRAQVVFEQVQFELVAWQPAFAALLKRAWYAGDLRDCATVSDLMHSIQYETAPVVWSAPVTENEDLPISELMAQIRRHVSRSLDKRLSFVTRIPSGLKAGRDRKQPQPASLNLRENEGEYRSESESTLR